MWKLDRLARSLKQLIETVNLLQDKQQGFRSLQEAIDTTTSTGKLFFHIFGALAEFERDVIRERTNAGLEAARARGRHGGRPTVMDDPKAKARPGTTSGQANARSRDLPHARHIESNILSQHPKQNAGMPRGRVFFVLNPFDQAPAVLLIQMAAVAPLRRTRSSADPRKYGFGTADRISCFGTQRVTLKKSAETRQGVHESRTKAQTELNNAQHI